MSWGLDDAFMGQYSDNVRHNVDQGYRKLLGRYVLTVEYRARH